MKNTILLLFFALSACGSGSDTISENGGDVTPGVSALNQGRIQFYKTTGDDSDLIPYHAIRIYDNATYSYSFWKDCSPLSSLKLYSSQQVGNSDNVITGPETFGPDCDIDVDFDYSQNVPEAVGEIRRNSSKRVADINMIKITEGEFRALLSNSSSGFEAKYNSSLSMQKRLDRMCNVLFGSDCDVSVLR